MQVQDVQNIFHTDVVLLMHGCIENVLVSLCVFENLMNVLRLKQFTFWNRGGTLTILLFSDKLY
jgi:polygalacturonase